MLLLPYAIIVIPFTVILATYIILKIVNKSAWYKTNKTKLLDSFRQQRHKSKSLQNKLSNYIMANNTHNAELHGGITYDDYLKQLKKNHALKLSKKKYIRLKSSNNMMLIKKTATELKYQKARLLEAESVIEKL